MLRIKQAQGDFSKVTELIAAVEELALQKEYNDQVAALRLLQGHLAWDGHVPDIGSGADAAFGYYQQALVYALRFNRFLLDEVLWGGGVTSPVRPLIPTCVTRGAAGRDMVARLAAWWRTGLNMVGTPRPDTISPLPEGIPLPEAERLAREREPGDGAPQQTVLERLTMVLNVP